VSSQLIAAIISATAAIIVAAISYAAQRRLDRKQEITVRLVEAYSALLSASAESLNLIGTARYQKEKMEWALDELDNQLHAFRRALSAALLYSGDKSFIDAIGGLDRLLWATRGHLRHERLGTGLYHRHKEFEGVGEAMNAALKAHAEALAAAKADISGLNMQNSRHLLENVLTSLRERSSK
jgi:hypothetical protein